MKTTILYKVLFISLLSIAAISCGDDAVEDDDIIDVILEENEGNSNNDDVVADEKNTEETDPNNIIDEEGGTDDKNENSPPSALSDAEIILELINDFRADEGLRPIVINEKLNEAALLHSQYMESINEVTESGADGSRFWHRTSAVGYEGSPKAENLSFGENSPEEVIETWMSKSSERAAILSSAITEMGLGGSGKYWTQILGSK